MSVWRRKAIECLPEERAELQDPGNSIYNAFSQLLGALITAHQENNTERLEKIYAFAEWCAKQPNKDIWNAAGVSFYEHLVDHKETLEVFPRWVKPWVYDKIKGLIEWRLEKDPDAFKWIDKHYNGRKK